MKYSKITEKEFDFPMSPEESQNLRSQAQNYQLTIHEKMAEIEELNNKVQTILTSLSSAKNVKKLKVVEEIDTELGMVKSYHNGQPVDLRPMTEDEVKFYDSQHNDQFVSESLSKTAQKIAPKLEHQTKKIPTQPTPHPDPEPSGGYHLTESIDPSFSEDEAWPESIV